MNGLNLYAYWLNNPVKMNDSTGIKPTWLKWWGVGAVILGAAIETLIGTGVGVVTGGKNRTAIIITDMWIRWICFIVIIKLENEMNLVHIIKHLKICYAQNHMDSILTALIAAS